MKRWLGTSGAALLLALTGGAHAEPPPPPWLGPTSRPPTPQGFQQLGLWESARSVPLESVGLVALITYTGFKDWKWGSASFRFDSEGWFGMNTGSGGLDKLGHAYGAYMTSELLYWRLRATHRGRWVSSFYPALFGTLLYQYIELFDGYSVDHGYSYEDSIMNGLGVALSFLRHRFPRFRQLFDYRLFYYPSGGSSFRPMIDYEGQKFFGVLKLAGVPGVERTPFRYVELFAGYYTRGFPRYANASEKSEHFMIGVGLSLSQTLFEPLERAHGEPFGFLNLASQYFQTPLYAASESVRREGR
ncbi:MAG: hypothetical protein K0R38_4722 [Polyangiaceae bacterium]|nr:hypothetical protein [Polyangiaceae bacterium]